MNSMNWTNNTIFKQWRLIVLLTVALGLFLMPNLLWGKLYMVGGDDGRFYYLFPFEYLKNFSFHIMSNNTLGGNMGYLAVSYSAPILLVLSIIKFLFPFLNTQFVAYGCIFALGFIFFYKFLQEWIVSKTTYTFWAAVFASVLYVLSPYVTRTYFQHQLIPIFIIMVLPASLYLFIAGVKRKNISFIAGSAIVYSFFSSTVYSFPWFLSVLFTLLPLFIYFTRIHRTYIWRALGIFLLLSALFNVYWIIHFLIPIIYHTGASLPSSILKSTTFIKQNNDLIAALVHLNSPVYQMISYLRTSWTEREGATVVESLGIAYMFVILSAGIVLKKATRSTRKLYVVAVSGLLFTMLFFTPSFGEWNLHMFQWLNNNVPLFGMFRNMYDKFSLAMSFQYAFVVYIALAVLEESRVLKFFRYIIVIILFTVLGVMAYPYIVPNISDGGYSTRISGNLNTDFMNMMTYLKNHPTSYRYVWLPMTYPGYIYISDATLTNHYYAGISPVQVLSGSSDLAGYYGIQTSLDPFLNGKVLALLNDKDYIAVAKILRSQNIGYVIVNHEKLPTTALAFLDQYDFMSSQGVAYSNIILGRKIQDFGTRYSLYTFNYTYRLPTAYTTDQIPPESDKVVPVNFQKLPGNTYVIRLSNIRSATSLAVSEPYSPLWEVSVVSGTLAHVLNVPHTSILQYGNVWTINPSLLDKIYPTMLTRHQDGSYDITLRVQFFPEQFVLSGIIISVISMVGSIIYIGIRRYETNH